MPGKFNTDRLLLPLILTEPLDLSQPTVSHHLKVLYEAGLLSRERRGSWVYDQLVPERLEALQQALIVP